MHAVGTPTNKFPIHTTAVFSCKHSYFQKWGLMGVCVTMVCCGANYMMYKIYHSVIYSVSYTLYVTVVLCDALVTSKGRV